VLGADLMVGGRTNSGLNLLVCSDALRNSRLSSCSPAGSAQLLRAACTAGSSNSSSRLGELGPQMSVGEHAQNPPGTGDNRSGGGLSSGSPLLCASLSEQPIQRGRYTGVMPSSSADALPRLAHANSEPEGLTAAVDLASLSYNAVPIHATISSHGGQAPLPKLKLHTIAAVPRACGEGSCQISPAHRRPKASDSAPSLYGSKAAQEASRGNLLAPACSLNSCFDWVDPSLILGSIKTELVEGPHAWHQVFVKRVIDAPTGRQVLWKQCSADMAETYPGHRCGQNTTVP
jgi:hypothetical protein